MAIALPPLRFKAARPSLMQNRLKASLRPQIQLFSFASDLGAKVAPSTLEAQMNKTTLTLALAGLAALPQLVPPQGLRSHVHQLRQVIDKPFDQALLHTVHGVGYRLAELADGV